MPPKYVEMPDGKVIEFPEFMSDALINKALMGSDAGIKESPLYQRVLQRVTPYARPALEYGGAVGGAVLGAPAGPAGAIAGTGLGYAIGRQGANALEQLAGQRQPQDALTEISNTGKDFVSGTGMEMGGQVAGAALQGVGNAIVESGIPQRIYARALRTPINETWKRAMPGADFTRREAAVQTGYGGEIVPNNAGLATAIKRTEEIGNDVKRTVQELTATSEAMKKTGVTAGSPSGNPVQRGWEDVIKEGRVPQKGYDTNVYDLVNEGMAGVNAKAVFSTKEGTRDSLNALRNRVVKMGGTSASLNPSQLQTLKQELWNDVNWDRTKQIVDPNGRLTEDAIHGIGNAAMKQLEHMAPELKYLNKKQGAYIDLQKAVEHTIARYENLNVGGLQAMILALKNVGLAATEVVMGTPTFKAKLAFTLGRIGQGGVGREVVKASMLGMTREDQ